jgi:hypothetical protein
MEGKELYLENGKPTGIFFCSECKVVHRTQKEADDCCICLNCREEKRVRYYTVCEKCKKIDDLERQKKKVEAQKVAFDKAVEVAKWKYVWFNEKMYSDLGQLIDDCEYGKIPIPKYVHAMKPVIFKGFSLNELLESFNESIEISDDYYNSENYLLGLDALKKAFDEFNNINEDTIIYWTVDYGKKVKTGE